MGDQAPPSSAKFAVMSSELTVGEQKVLVELQIRREVSRHLHLRIRPESADLTSQDFGMNITFAPPYIDDPRGGYFFSMAMLLPINSSLVHEPYLYGPCGHSDDTRLLDASLGFAAAGLLARGKVTRGDGDDVVKVLAARASARREM